MVDVSEVRGKNHSIVRRILLVILLGGFFALGPAALGRVHEAQSQRMWETQIARLLKSGALPRSTPPQAPHHDSSSCVICNLLHTPAISETNVAFIVGAMIPTARMNHVDLVPASSPSSSSPLCRGPPQFC
jgi:hypothetical protein